MYYTYVRKALFGKWGGYQSDIHVPDWMEWPYRIKAAICLFFNFGAPLSISDSDFSDHVIITFLSSGDYYTPGEATTYWFEALIVGRGWCNWWCEVHSDSN